MKSRNITHAALLAGMSALLCIPPALPAQAGAASRPAAAAVRRQAQLKAKLEAYGRLPLSFEPNRGQAPPAARYLAHGAGYTLLLTAKGAVLALAGQGKPTTVRMRLAGVRQQPVFSGRQELAGRVNYLIGNDPARWHTQIPLYRQVRAANVYRGIDLVYYGNRGRLEYDFVVHPGADPGAIRLLLEGLQRRPQIAGNGDLLAATASGRLRLLKPVAYQPATGNAARRQVRARFAQRADGTTGFQLGGYDPRRQLVIDPILVYSTLLGSPGGNENTDPNPVMALDSSGDAYVAGRTVASDFPTTNGAYNTTYPGGTCSNHNGGTQPCEAIFITKLNATGTALVYSTYFGGTNNDEVTGIGLDSTGDAYLTGNTFSSDLPVTSGAFQKTLSAGQCAVNGIGPCPDAFLTELNASGSALVYSSYLGGAGPSTAAGISGANAGEGIAVGSSTAVYISGVTASSSFPTTSGAYQASYPGGSCSFMGSSGNCPVGFVAKFNPTLAGASSLVYSTYLGGSGGFTSFDPFMMQNGGPMGGIAVDASGNAYIAGFTNDPHFPATANLGSGSGPGAANCVIGGSSYPCGVAFITKLNAAGTAPAYSKFLGNGASAYSGAVSIALDSSDNAYITGYTTAGFPTTTGVLQTTYGGGDWDAFVAKISSSGSLDFSTYLGGSGSDFIMPNGNRNPSESITVDSTGDIYVIGITNSSDFPLKNPLQNALNEGNTCTTNNSGSSYTCSDAYISVIKPDGSGLIFSSYLGSGYSDDEGNSIAVDSGGNIYAAGETNAQGSGANYYFPTTTGAYQTNASLPCCESVSFISKISLATPATVVALPTSLVFNNQEVGTSSSQNITLTNNTTSAVTPQSMGFSGANASEFLVNLGASTCVIGAQIAANGGTCLLAVTNTPTQTGGESATLTVTTDSSATPSLSVTLSGNAVSGGAVSFAPASLSFGNQLAGTTSAAQTVTITNNGTGPLGNLSITTTSSAQNYQAFPFTTDCGNTLAVSASCHVNISFAPNASGAVSGELQVNDDAIHSPQSIPLSGTGVLPVVALTPTTLSFANQGLGSTSAAQTVTLNNSGNSGLTIASIGITGDFTQTNNCPLTPSTLSGGSGCSLQISFKPTATGSRTGTLTVTDDSNNVAGSTQTVALSGNGISGGAVSLNPTSLSFGNQLAGTTSAPQTVTLTNSGTGALGNIVITSSSQMFKVSSNCPVSPATLAVGSNCAIQVTFSPSLGGGAESGTIQIADDAANSPQSFGVSGTGTLPTAALNPNNLNFGEQVILTASVAQTITLTNSGNGPLTINSIAAGGDFAETNNCPAAPATLAAGSNCAIQVTFTPSALGTRNGTLTFTDNSNAIANNTQTAALTGTGVSAGKVSLAPASLAFGDQMIKSSSAAQTVTLANSGTGPLGSLAIAITGSGFAQTNNCPATLAAGSTCAIQVTFSPSATGAVTGSVQISDDAAGSPQSLALSGTGVMPVAALSPSSLTFTDQKVGTSSAAQTVTLANTGTGPLTLASLTISGDFTETNNCPAPTATLAAGSSCSIHVVFTPTAEGTRTGTLTATDNTNAVAGSTQSMPLSGTGATHAMQLSASSINFHNEPVGVASSPQILTITNSGSASLNFTAIGLSGANAADFAIAAGSTTCSTSTAVAAGATCTIGITFNPGAATVRNATLSLADDAPNSPQSVALTGNGVDFSFGLPAGTPTTITVTPGGNGVFNLTINPQGNSKQTVTMACSGAPPFSTCSVIPSSFTLDGTHAVTVQVMITTSSGSWLPPLGPGNGPGLPPAIWLGLAGLLAAGLLGLRRQGRRRAVWGGLAGLLLFSAMLAGCSNTRTNATPAGNYPLQITAASGSQSHTITLNLIVTQCPGCNSH